MNAAILFLESTQSISSEYILESKGRRILSTKQTLRAEDSVEQLVAWIFQHLLEAQARSQSIFHN